MTNMDEGRAALNKVASANHIFKSHPKYWLGNLIVGLSARIVYDRIVKQDKKIKEMEFKAAWVDAYLEKNK